MPSPSLILSVALAASFVPLSNLSRSHFSVRREEGPSDVFSDTLSELKEQMRTKLHEDKVIPDVIMEVPEQPVAVFYPHTAVMMGNHIEPAALRYVPQFFFKTNPDRFYTVMLVGPDYPSREMPSERNRLMWLVTNYARNATYTLRPIGLVSYEQARPLRDSGKMRFVFLVYEQPTDKDWRKSLVETPTSLTNFVLEWYVDRNGLTLVAVNYFIIDTGQEKNSFSNQPFGRVTDQATVTVTGGEEVRSTPGNNSGTGEKKTGTRENDDRVGENVTDAPQKEARTSAMTAGPGEKKTWSGQKAPGPSATGAGTREKATSAGEQEARPSEKVTTIVDKKASAGENVTAIDKKTGRAEKGTEALANFTHSGEQTIRTGEKETRTGEKATGSDGKAFGTVLKELTARDNRNGSKEKEAGTFEKQPGGGYLQINAGKNKYVGARFLGTGAEETRRKQNVSRLQRSKIVQVQNLSSQKEARLAHMTQLAERNAD